MSDTVAKYCGSTAFIWAHCIFFGLWLFWNTFPTVPKSLKIDHAPFPVLTLIVSLEAIFLSTFILISQNRQRMVNDERTHLDLQINMLAEQESSHMLQMLMEIRAHLGITGQAETEESDAGALGTSTDFKQMIEHLKDNVDSIKD